MWKKYCRARQAADGITIRRMRVVCFISKAPDTHSEYVILIAFPLQQWLHESTLVLRYTYIACLVKYFVPSTSRSSRWALVLRFAQQPFIYCVTIVKQYLISECLQDEYGIFNRGSDRVIAELRNGSCLTFRKLKLFPSSHRNIGGTHWYVSDRNRCSWSLNPKTDLCKMYIQDI